MKLKHYPPTPKLGDTKTIIKFAWWPTRVEDSLIWLERYEAVYEWQAGYGHSSESYWDLESTKLIVNTPGLPDFKNHPPAPTNNSKDPGRYNTTYINECNKDYSK